MTEPARRRKRRRARDKKEETMITETTDDIFACRKPSVILNQVNCLGYVSAGLMGRVVKRWPALFREYHELCGWFKGYKPQHGLLGMMQALKVPGTRMILCNAFSQKYYSDTKYEALPGKWEEVLRKIAKQVEANFKATGVMHEIHCPAKIGPGLKPEETASLREAVERVFGRSEIPFIYHI